MNNSQPTGGGEQTTTEEALSGFLHCKDDEIAQLKRQIAEMTRPQSSNQPPNELAGPLRQNTLRKETLGQVRRRIDGDNDAGGSLDSGDKDLIGENEGKNGGNRAPARGTGGLSSDVIMPDGDDSGLGKSDAEPPRHSDSLGESGAGLASGAIVMAEGGAGLAGAGIALAEDSAGQSGSAAGLASGGARRVRCGTVVHLGTMVLAEGGAELTGLDVALDAHGTGKSGGETG
ncbi:hypothetical protein QAD02_020351 [Eretmocerus hayati]|uniref:Uncharacterized protein n=1 Tax=Eretmocerus hayati TaxID=131215 RepID=A0ACC2PPN6_9HYME|nr:hypothetical protein QAD02_020351 [Eretmocerus hayati]